MFSGFSLPSTVEWMTWYDFSTNVPWSSSSSVWRYGLNVLITETWLPISPLRLHVSLETAYDTSPFNIPTYQFPSRAGSNATNLRYLGSLSIWMFINNSHPLKWGVRVPTTLQSSPSNSLTLHNLCLGKYWAFSSSPFLSSRAVNLMTWGSCWRMYAMEGTLLRVPSSHCFWSQMKN